MLDSADQTEGSKHDQLPVLPAGPLYFRLATDAVVEAMMGRESLWQFLRRVFPSRQRDVVERRPGPLAPLAPLDFARNNDGSYVTPEQSDEGWSVQ